MKPSYVRAIFKTFSSLNPHPETELLYTNHYTLLVAIILSAQATDVGVNKATPALFEKADTPKKMIKLGESALKTYIKSIGLFNTKAANIIAMSEQLITKFKGQIPEELDLLKTLPGVGRKTANVWLNCALGLPTIAVDTHVYRVAQRLGLVDENQTVLATEYKLGRVIPDMYKQHAHHWLILHGRYICKARNPECYKCPVARWCSYEDKNFYF